MLELVDVGPRSLSAYRGVAPDAVLDDLVRHAEDLRGARVLHVNATPYGGGVSELLRSGVPILNDLGLTVHWKIIRGDDRFFQVTKKVHNGLQGAADGLTETEREAYLGTSRRNAELLEEEYDFVFLHDPQPAGILSLRGKGNARWVWRCHIDTSQPNPSVWTFLHDYLEPFDAAVFTMEAFVPPDFPIARVEIMPPAIDPLSPKNMPLADATARGVLAWIGVEVDRPLITQVSRFDLWKDPLGVIGAYRLAREEVPAVQLALVGSMALDDPEGWDVYRHVRCVAIRSGHPCLHQPDRCGQHRGQCVSAPLTGRGPEVDPGGVWTRRVGGALERHAGRRGERGRDPAADGRWCRGRARANPSRSARRRSSHSSGTPSTRAIWHARVASACASTFCYRDCY